MVLSLLQLLTKYPDNSTIDIPVCQGLTEQNFSSFLTYLYSDSLSDSSVSLFWIAYMIVLASVAAIAPNCLISYTT